MEERLVHRPALLRQDGAIRPDDLAVLLHGLVHLLPVAVELLADLLLLTLEVVQDLLLLPVDLGLGLGIAARVPLGLGHQRVELRLDLADLLVDPDLFLVDPRLAVLDLPFGIDDRLPDRLGLGGLDPVERGDVVRLGIVERRVHDGSAHRRNLEGVVLAPVREEVDGDLLSRVATDGEVALERREHLVERVGRLLGQRLGAGRVEHEDVRLHLEPRTAFDQGRRDRLDLREGRRQHARAVAEGDEALPGLGAGRLRHPLDALDLGLRDGGLAQAHRFALRAAQGDFQDDRVVGLGGDDALLPGAVLEVEDVAVGGARRRRPRRPLWRRRSRDRPRGSGRRPTPVPAPGCSSPPSP